MTGRRSDEAVLAGRRLLVLEDVAPTRQLIRRRLEAAGAEVILAVDRFSLLLACCEEARPDLVVLDLHVPDGEVLSLVPGLLADLPCVVFTGQVDARIRQDCQQMSVLEVISKSRLPVDLPERLARHVDRAPHAEAEDDTELPAALRGRFLEELERRQGALQQARRLGRTAECAEHVAHLSGNCALFGFAAIGRAAGLAERALATGDRVGFELMTDVIEHLIGGALETENP